MAWRRTAGPRRVPDRLLALSVPPNSRRPRRQPPQRRAGAAQDRPRERPPVSAPVRRRSSRTNEQQQTLLLIAGGVVALAIVVIGFGYYVQYLRKPALPVAVVNGHTISAQDYQLETKLRNADLEGRVQAVQARLAAAPNDSDLKRQVQTLQGELGASTDQATTDLIDQYLVSLALPALRQQGAPAAGFVVGDQDVAARLAQWKANNNVATDAEYRQALDRIGVSDSQLRDYLRAQILNERVEAYVARDVAATQPEVKAAQLTIADKAKADEALGKLKANGDFESIVQQYSTDAAVKATGGELGWMPKGLQSTAFDGFAFAPSPPGPFASSDVLQDNGTYVIVRVQDRASMRPLGDVTLNALKDKQFQNWLLTQEHAASIQRYPQNQS